MKSFPLALEPPSGTLVTIDTAMITKARSASRESPRGRIILPLHTSAADPLQRMLNAIQPGSYIRPHRHADPPKSETILLLRGAITYLTFDNTGALTQHITLSAAAERFGMDTKPGVYHTFFALEPDTILFEVKPGPYDPKTDKDFAPWAPEEGSPEADAILAQWQQATTP